MILFIDRLKIKPKDREKKENN